MSAFKTDEEVSLREAVAYTKSYIETLKDRIEQGDPRARLYKEQILMFTKLLEGC